MSSDSSAKDVTPSPANNTLSVNYWEQRWTDNNIGWHELEGNQLLVKNLERVLRDYLPGRKPEDLKVFVPLCGKTKDLYLFYKLGFSAVVGLEFASQAISEFFAENDIEADTSDPLLTKSVDGRLMMARGDLFEIGHSDKLPFPKYDIIWDRGSFVAINEDEREKYAKQMLSLLNEGGLYLMNLLTYDRSEYGGPPLAATEADILQYFGPNHKPETIEVADRLAEDRSDRQRWIDKGLTKMTEILCVFR